MTKKCLFSIIRNEDNKTQKFLSKVKPIFISFFDGIHMEIVPTGDSISGPYYLNDLKSVIL